MASGYKFPKGSKHPNWRGGTKNHPRGYISISSPNHPYRTKDGYVFESRLIMEKQIGRYLLPYERVHHVNGDPTDNRIENLVMLTQKVHIRNHSNPNAKWNLLDDSNWLKEHYINEHKQQNQLAKILCCSKTTVKKYLRIFNIRKYSITLY